MKLTILLLVLEISCCTPGGFRERTPSKPEGTPITQTATSTLPATTPDGPIRRIDFSNFNYDWYPLWADTPPSGRRIILKNGQMDLGFSYGKEPRKFFLIDDGVNYGDLDDDGVEEAVVILGVITSGTARQSLIFVYRMSGEQPERLWVYETGDRWDYGYHAAYIDDGKLVVERYKPFILEYQGQKHNISSSNAYIRDYYKWNGKSFNRTKGEEVPTDPNDKNPWVTHNGNS